MIRNNYYDLIELYEDLVSTLVDQRDKNPHSLLGKHLYQQTISLRREIEGLREELDLNDLYEQ